MYNTFYRRSHKKVCQKPTRPTIKIECHLFILYSIPNGVAYVLFEHLCILGF